MGGVRLGIRRGGRGRLSLQERRELEIDDAEAAILLPVGDVAGVGVIMADTERLQLGEQALESLSVEMLDPLAAIGRDDLGKRRIRLEKSRDEGATAPLQMPQDPHFRLETTHRIGPVVGFDDPSIEAQVNGRTQCVLDLQHDADPQTNPGPPAGQGKACQTSASPWWPGSFGSISPEEDHRERMDHG